MQISTTFRDPNEPVSRAFFISFSVTSKEAQPICSPSDSR